MSHHAADLDSTHAIVPCKHHRAPQSQYHQVLNRVFLTFFALVLLPASTVILALLSANAELGLVLREVKDGMYSPLAY